MRTKRALRLVRKLRAAEAEVSAWEGEFLESVETRLNTYGRAFADPEKGGRDTAVSVRQQRKLKEIVAKVAGEAGMAVNPAPRAGRVRRKRAGARRAAPARDGEADD